MRVAMLRQHGVDVDDSDANRWTVAPGPIAPVDHEIEPDLSNSAPFLALAAVTGGSVTGRDWPAETHPAGHELREVLTRMGCSVTMDADRSEERRAGQRCVSEGQNRWRPTH